MKSNYYNSNSLKKPKIDRKRSNNTFFAIGLTLSLATFATGIALPEGNPDGYIFSNVESAQKTDDTYTIVVNDSKTITITKEELDSMDLTDNSYNFLPGTNNKVSVTPVKGVSNKDVLVLAGSVCGTVTGAALITNNTGSKKKVKSNVRTRGFQRG